MFINTKDNTIDQQLKRIRLPFFWQLLSANYSLPIVTHVDDFSFSYCYSDSKWFYVNDYFGMEGVFCMN